VPADAAEGSTEFEEFRESVHRQIPPVVYLPVNDAGDRSVYEVELRTTRDGRVALLAYTALDRLGHCCGPHQPWVLYPTDRLHELEQSQPYDVIYLDVPIPEGLRRGPADATVNGNGADADDGGGAERG